MKFTRRETMILAAAASAVSLSGLSGAQAAEGDMVDMAKLMAPAGGLVDKVEGNPDAPVTVIEYASPTCPHCATKLLPRSLYSDKPYWVCANWKPHGQGCITKVYISPAQLAALKSLQPA